ncbi:MAG: LuxR C-terminal-related transcriptional regulator [Desulfobulbaceae bacterium]|nr:LuxR C-terminal-related transcriptional regulator [Desulfobulbaceae bacterium]
MSLGSLSKIEQSMLLQIISDCAYCTSLEKVQDIAFKVGDLLQSANIVFLSAGLDFQKGLPAIQEVNISYPTEWTSMYKSQNFIDVDPVINVRRSGLLYWKDIYRELPPTGEFYSQAKSFGLSSGFSHILVGNNTFGLMSVADDKLRNSRRSRNIINTIAPHFHQLIARLLRKQSYQKLPRLTSREREVLLWVMDGKSNWEISVILSIGQESVKDYIAKIFRKLNASNRAHAVAIALQYDLLLPFV